MGVKPSKLIRKSGLSEKSVRVNSNKIIRYNIKDQEEPKMYERSNGISGSLSGSNKQNTPTTTTTTTTYEREMMGFAFKKAEWKQERKKLKEEVKVLRALVDEKEEKIREMKEEKEKEKHGGFVEIDNNGDGFVGQKWGFLGTQQLILVDQMREERARRDETVEKWKQLYLAIKMELDDLIQRTHEGGLYWRAEEEDIAEELKKEVQSKEETIKELKSKLGSMEQQVFKREREVDILRQSLKIMSSKKILPPKYPPRKVAATPNTKVATNFNNNNKK